MGNYGNLLRVAIILFIGFLAFIAGFSTDKKLIARAGISIMLFALGLFLLEAWKDENLLNALFGISVSIIICSTGLAIAWALSDFGESNGTN